MKDMKSAKAHGLVDGIKPEGLVEIEIYRAGKLIEVIREKNIILYQGNKEIITSLAEFPVTKPRLIARMAIGDQGTIPSDSTVPKVPVKSMNALYHEIYRKTVDDKVITTGTTGTTFNIAATLIINNALVTTTSTSEMASGMAVSGTGIPSGTIIQAVNSNTQFLMSQQATVSGSQTLAISGVANECRFVATFNAVDVPLTSYSNPSQPRVNEVGMVIIDPTAVAGLPGSRLPVSAPTTPPADEVLASIRTFKSVPFEIANDVSITIRYTIFLT